MRALNIQASSPGFFSSNKGIKKAAAKKLNLPQFVVNFKQVGIGCAYLGNPNYEVTGLVAWTTYVVACKPTDSGDGFVDIIINKKENYRGDSEDLRQIGGFKTNGNSEIIEESISTLNSGGFVDVQEILTKAGLYSSVFPTDYKPRGQYFDEQANFAGDVVSGNVVFKDADGLYKNAIADGTYKSNAIGIADRVYNNRGFVVFSGLFTIGENFTGRKLYLSPTTAGKIVTKKSHVYLGEGLTDEGLIYLTIQKDDSKRGTLTEKEIYYRTYFERLSFDQMFMKDFVTNPDDDDEIDYGLRKPSFFQDDELLSGVSGDSVVFNVCNDVNAGYEKLYVTFQTDRNVLNNEYEIEFETDGQDNWTKMSKDTKTPFFDGFDQLRVKFTWRGSFKLQSFACLFDERFEAFASETQFRKRYTVKTATSLPVEYQLPDYTIYTNDENSLSVYWNGLRLFVNVHYVEVNKRTIRIKSLPMETDMIYENDIFEFEQRYGYVDVSTETRGQYLKEHDGAGYHILPDVAKDGIYYRLIVENGQLKLLPVDRG